MIASMGLFDSGVKKGRDRQKQSLLEEAQKAGTRVVAVDEMEGENSASNVLGAMAKAMVGGTVRGDGAALLVMDYAGSPHLYLQPYAGMNPLPGEHHALLRGSLPVAALLKSAKFLGRPEWTSPADPRLGATLNLNPAVAALVKRVKWEWAIGMSAIELEWAVQFRSLGDGNTHVVMKPGRYGGLTTYHVGFALFLDLCRTLQGWLQPAQNPRQEFIEPVGGEALLPALYGQPLGQAGAVAAFVSQDPAQGISMHEAEQLQQQLQAGLQAGDFDAQVNAAARLMTAGQYGACIQAYEQIGRSSPAHAALCHSQIGAAWFFLGNYERALSHYEWAKQNGADPQMMDDNIAEAHQAMQART